MSGRSSGGCGGYWQNSKHNSSNFTSDVINLYLDKKNCYSVPKYKGQNFTADLCVFGSFGWFSSLAVQLTADLTLESSNRSSRQLYQAASSYDRPKLFSMFPHNFLDNCLIWATIKFVIKKQCFINKWNLDFFHCFKNKKKILKLLQLVNFISYCYIYYLKASAS